MLWWQLCATISTLLFNHLFSFNPLIISSVRQSLFIRPKPSSLLHAQLSTQAPPHCTHWGMCRPFARGCHNLPCIRSPAFASALWWGCSNLITSHTHSYKIQLTTSPTALYPQQQNGKREKRGGSNTAHSAQSKVSSRLPAPNMQDKFSVVLQSMILES